MTTSPVLGSPGASSLTPGASSLALASVTGAVAACSLVGNAFVFLTISRSKTLQRINNALILSLAVADLLRSSTVLPLYAALLLVDLSPSDQRWLCPLYGVLFVFCELAVVLNVTLIAAERVFVITNPLVYQRTVTLPRISVVIASLWTVSLVFGAMQALRYHPEAADHRSESAAFTSVVCFSVPSLGYAVFDVTLTLVVPLVTLVVCYGRIFFVVHSQMRRIVPATSDTYGGNSEAVSTLGELGRQAYATRSTSLSFREGSVGHGPFFEQRRHQQGAVFTVDASPSGSVRGADGPIAVASFFSTVRPLSNIEEDRAVASRGHEESNAGQERSEKAGDDDHRDGDRPIRILVTQPSRESINPTTVGGNPLQESTLDNYPLPPGVVPSADEPELILSPVNLNRTTSVSRSYPNSNGALSIRRGSSVTFDLKDVADMTSDLQRTTIRRGSNAATKNTGCSSLPLPGDGGTLTPARSIRVRPSFESSSSRVSTNPSSLGVAGLGRRNSIARINDNKAFKMTLVVVGAFVVCWVPAKVCYLLRVTSATLISDLTFDIVTCLAFVASALDPYVYNFYSAEFRRALKRVLTCSADKPDMPWM